MQTNPKVKKLQDELVLLRKNVGELLADEGLYSSLRSDKRQRVEVILKTFYEAIHVLEKGAVIIAMSLTDTED